MFCIDPTKHRTDGLKVPLKNIFDKNLYKSIEPLCSFIHEHADHDIIPNVITTASLLVRVYGLFALDRNRKLVASLCFFGGYYLDCVDGFYARKYNKCTPFGCAYDHFNDIVTCMFFGVVAWRKKMHVTVIMLILLTFFTANQIMCDEAVFSNKTHFFDLICTRLNSFKLFNSDEFVKYFGTTTWILLVSLAILIE